MNGVGTSRRGRKKRASAPTKTVGASGTSPDDEPQDSEITPEELDALGLSYVDTSIGARGMRGRLDDITAICRLLRQGLERDISQCVEDEKRDRIRAVRDQIDQCEQKNQEAVQKAHQRLKSAIPKPDYWILPRDKTHQSPDMWLMKPLETGVDLIVACQDALILLDRESAQRVQDAMRERHEVEKAKADEDAKNEALRLAAQKAGVASGESREKKAQADWKPHAQKLAREKRSKNPSWSNNKLSIEISADLAKVSKDAERDPKTVVKEIKRMENSGELPKQQK